MLDLVFLDSDDAHGGFYDTNRGLDYHVTVTGEGCGWGGVRGWGGWGAWMSWRWGGEDAPRAALRNPSRPLVRCCAGGRGELPTLRVVHVAAEMAPIAKVRARACCLLSLASRAHCLASRAHLLPLPCSLACNALLLLALATPPARPPGFAPVLLTPPTPHPTPTPSPTHAGGRAGRRGHRSGARGAGGGAQR